MLRIAISRSRAPHCHFSFPRSAWERTCLDALRRIEQRRAVRAVRSHAERGNEDYSERGNEDYSERGNEDYSERGNEDFFIESGWPAALALL
jgi:hypothetical protein